MRNCTVASDIGVIFQKNRAFMAELKALPGLSEEELASVETTSGREQSCCQAVPFVGGEVGRVVLGAYLDGRRID